MPRQKSVPSYRLHKARKCAVVTIGGRNHYLGPFGSAESKEKYARLIAGCAGLAPGASGVKSNPLGRLTVTELCAVYLEWASTYYIKNGRPTSQIGMIRMALRS